MGVLEHLVHEGTALRRQAGAVELARRDHDLSVVAPEAVPVDVHVHEGVVRAELLELRVDGVERARIP